MTAFGGTPFYEALAKSKMFFDNCKADRKILLVMTDAGFFDNYYIKPLMKQMTENGIEIAALGIGSSTESLKAYFSNFTLLEDDDLERLPEAVMSISKQLVSKAIA